MATLRPPRVGELRHRITFVSGTYVSSPAPAHWQYVVRLQTMAKIETVDWSTIALVGSITDAKMVYRLYLRTRSDIVGSWYVYEGEPTGPYNGRAPGKRMWKIKSQVPMDGGEWLMLEVEAVNQ